jgi:hypothetical protein
VPAGFDAAALVLAAPECGAVELLGVEVVLVV